MPEKWVVHGGYVPVRTLPGIRRSLSLKLLELNCSAIPLAAAGGGGIVAVPGEAVAGLGAAHPSDSCAIGFIEIAADLESLEMVSATRAESIGFSPDGRPPLIPSLIRAAAWDERCGGIEETCTLSTGSADAGHARVGLPVAKARSAKKTAKRWAPGGVAASSGAPMPSRSFRPQYSLTWKDLLAGSPL